MTQRLELTWKQLYEEDFNGAAKDVAATPVQQRAAALAGSWKELYRCRLEKDREVNPPLLLDSVVRSTAIFCRYLVSGTVFCDRATMLYVPFPAIIMSDHQV